MPTLYDPDSLCGPPSTDLPKPRVPYIAGWRFTATSHVPPAPTPVLWNGCNSKKSDMRERSEVVPVERCLKHPPLRGPAEDGNGNGNATVTLEIIHVLKGGDGHNSQVVTAQLISSSRPLLPRRMTKVVAKIYDPLYVDDDDGFLNPFLCTDKYYTHEAKAYEALSEYQGHGIPRYYGSYSLTLPVDSSSAEHGRTRTVRLILIEHIPGNSMAEADPRNFSQSARQSILRSIVDLESRIYGNKDIDLDDLDPRNIIISNSNSSRRITRNTRPQPAVVFVDFGDALFNRRPDDPVALKVDLLLGQYISPLLRWKEREAPRWIEAFEEWIDWDWDPWLEAEFAHTAVTITPKIRKKFQQDDDSYYGKHDDDEDDD